jgi:predicted unusual protein kinase regulating ubiquinone biosynthesis (AarF/ABC1/UbiB family)
MRDELGSGPDELFARFDRDADRVGVDRAGAPGAHPRRTEVAVKVQYPGVDEAVRGDLENTDLLFQP